MKPKCIVRLNTKKELAEYKKWATDCGIIDEIKTDSIPGTYYWRTGFEIKTERALLLWLLKYGWPKKGL